MLTDTHWRIAREYAEGARIADLADRHGLEATRVHTMIRSVRTAITRDNDSSRGTGRKVVPDPRDAIAAELIKQGVVYREIAERTGLGYGVLKRIRLSLNLPARKRGAHTNRVVPRREYKPIPKLQKTLKRRSKNKAARKARRNKHA